MALRDYKYEQQETEQSFPVSPYYDYQELNEDGQRLKELMFFLNIAIFSVACVLASFIFLSLRLQPILAIALAIPVGLLTMQAFQLTLKWRKRKKAGR